jgi:Ca2+-binding EF-hand superfamily protein
MKKFFVVATTLVAGFAIGLAQAEDGKEKGKGKGGDPVKRAEGMIKNLDKDGNGTLSKEEFAASPNAAKMKEKGGEGAIDKVFAARDTNKDGQLDKAELSAPPKGKGDKGKPKAE